MSFSDDPWDSVPAEELLRAQAYSLLGRLLSEPPSADFLGALRTLKGDNSELGQSFRALAGAARHITHEEIETEYRTLFIGTLGVPPQVIPYGSHYHHLQHPAGASSLTVSMLEQLHNDMERLGISMEDEDDHEPEDHIATLCEMMAGLITGAFGTPSDLETQNHFFDSHLAPWAALFFQQLEAAPAAAFYMPVGSFGRCFLAVEIQAFALAA